jgi:putative tryptophan/tyrosine transport system substrate-binding protein
MRRRKFITLLGGAAVAWPFAARSQRSNPMQIGVLLFERDGSIIKAFLQGLQEFGYVDGTNVVIEYRFAEGKFERLPELAAELVRLNPTVIFSLGAELAPIIKDATATIPIVVLVSDDPVESGLVKSLARPGGNLTGLTFVNDQLAGKALELLKEAAPQVSRVAILWNPDHPDLEFQATQHAAGGLGVALQSLEARVSDDFDVAFQFAISERAEALVVVSSRRMTLQRRRIGDFVVTNRLVMVSGQKLWLQYGGLLSYGPNVLDMIRQTATYIDKILKGAKAADLPIQQPTSLNWPSTSRPRKRLASMCRLAANLFCG